MTESTSTQYHQLTCSYCGSSMSLKVKKTDGKLFFGCDNYQLHREKNTSLNLKEGLRLLKHKNKPDIVSMVDLDDEY